MSRPATTPRPRLSGPGELAAALPLLCGFRPRESLVVVTVRGPNNRVALTARYDLPALADEDLLALDVAARLDATGAQRAFAAVVSEHGPGLPRRPMVSALRAAVDRRGLELVDVLLVRAGRWWSYVCSDSGCCPTNGRPVPESSPALTLVRAEAALDGRAVLGSRKELVSSLAPPAGDAQTLALLRDVERCLAEELAESGRASLRRRLLAAMDSALLDPEVSHARAAELALALHDVHVRDEVLTWSLRRESALLTLLLALARRTPGPYDAPVCACLAWVAYSRGDGATAGIALERALATDGRNGLALLLAGALNRQVPPRELRAVAVRTATALRRRP